MEHVVVIGSGIAGMASAYLLAQRYRVTLLERDARTGGHTNTVELPTSGGPLAVDTGFIVYNEVNYPHFTALLDHLGVASQPSEMTFSVSVDGGAFEYAGSNLATLFCQPRNLLRPAFLGLLRDILRFNRVARALLGGSGTDARMTLGEFLDIHDLGQRFRDLYLLPMAGAIWSCPPARMLTFPALSLARFYANHGLLDLWGRPQWRTVRGGSRRYIDALLGPLQDQVRVDAGVRQVRRRPGGVSVLLDDGHQLDADRVVFASHADQTLAMLADASEDERRLLGAFRYQPNRAVLHTDASLMPRRRLAWSAWNYLASRSPDGQMMDGEAQVSVSYWMNCLQRLPGDIDYIVSLNPLHEPDPARVIAAFDYEHPVFSVEAMAAQGRLGRIQGQHSSWFCGAWCGYGFHEDGLRSAVRVAEHMQVPVPWAASVAPGRPRAEAGDAAPRPAPAEA